MRTSCHAGGITSASIRASFASSVIALPRESRYRNRPRDPTRRHPPLRAIGATVSAAVDAKTIVVLEGDETGQELLEEALRVLAPDVTGLELEFPRHDLSLESRRASGNEVVHRAAGAIRDHGLGLKAATITPEGRDDVGSPNRILREEIG